MCIQYVDMPDGGRDDYNHYWKIIFYNIWYKLRWQTLNDILEKYKSDCALNTFEQFLKWLNIVMIESRISTQSLLQRNKTWEEWKYNSMPVNVF